MAQRREQASRRREELLDAALAVFAERGVDGATVKDIATAAAVTGGLLYHYFPSKQALLAAVVAERGFLPEMRQRLEGCGQRPAREVLVELAEAFGRLLAERAELVRVFLSGAASDPSMRDELAGVVEEGRRLLGGYLAARTAAGELRVHDTRTAAQMLCSAIVLGQVTGIAPDPAVLVELILHGLAAPSAPEQPTHQRRPR